MLFDKKILVVDDDPDNIRTFELILRKENFQITGALSGSEALQKVRETFFPVALLDVRMPRMGGVELLKKISQISPETLVALVSAYGKPDAIEEAYKQKAYDFIEKPVDNNLLLIKVRTAYQQFLTNLKNEQFRRRIMYRYPVEAFVHKSAIIDDMFNLVKKIGQTDETVLILGESGAGKELVARAIHWFSARREKRFQAVLPPSFSIDTLESTLFGHEKGAFTGAQSTKKGYFEEYSDDTLFLDEIGDINERIQTSLLRVIQEKMINRMGGREDISINTRIILATNKNLKEKVEAGQFREDLFYRINASSITVPPLRERKEDVPVLIDFWLKGHDVEISDSAMEILCNYDYQRNNVRELINCLKFALFQQENGKIEPEHLPSEVTGKSSPQMNAANLFEMPWKIAKEKFLKSYLEHLMKRTGGNVTKAAEISGIDRTDLHRKLKHFSIKYKNNHKS